jgi:hypothetical protein
MSTIVHVIDRCACVAYVQAECEGCHAVGPRVECGLKYDHDAVVLARATANLYEHRVPRTGKRGQTLRGQSVVGLCRSCAASRYQELASENAKAIGAPRATDTAYQGRVLEMQRLREYLDIPRRLTPT